MQTIKKMETTIFTSGKSHSGHKALARGHIEYSGNSSPHSRFMKFDNIWVHNQKFNKYHKIKTTQYK